MRVLVTGGHGFVGRHLAHHLVECGDDVALTYHHQKVEDDDIRIVKEGGIALPKSSQSLFLDVTVQDAVEKVVSLLKPDAIFHLAALTFVPQGESHFREMMLTNFEGTRNILEALRKHSKNTHFLLISSSEVYGDPRPGSLPLVETAELRPFSNYGVSKAAAEMFILKSHLKDGLNTVCVRPFPHLGPGQSERFAISNFAKQLALIKLGRAKPVVKVGNLETKRDYSDVSDIVRGYREALLNGKKGEIYNLCSGSSISIGDLLKTLIKVAEVETEIEVDHSRLRGIEVAEHCGSFQRAQRHFGWRPRINLEGTMHSLFAYWLERMEKVKGGGGQF